MKTRKKYQDLFITALEGGGNYWAGVISAVNSEKLFNQIMDEGYILTVKDVEDPTETWTVSKEDIRGSLTVLRREYPDVYKNVQEGSFDALDADLWFQLVAIGELTFS